MSWTNKDLSVKEKNALMVLDAMPEEDFQKFFKTIPYRVQLCCHGGLVDWKEVLPYWYVKLNTTKLGKIDDAEAT